MTLRTSPALTVAVVVVLCSTDPPLDLGPFHPQARGVVVTTLVRDRCPKDMAHVGRACMDLYEAPNIKGERPLIMQSALDGEVWCSERGKRLCTEGEWTDACEGPEVFSFPYGTAWEPGRCNDGKPYVGRNEDLLNLWPKRKGLLEVERLWQGSVSGAHEGCVGFHGVFDLTGNVEEWTRRSDPQGAFAHVLKGRFWSGKAWTCREGVYNHADRMFYYETGFRCCMDL